MKGLVPCDLRGAVLAEGEAIWHRESNVDALYGQQVAIQRPPEESNWPDHGEMGVVCSRAYYLRAEPEPYYQVDSYLTGGRLSGGGSFHRLSTLLLVEDAD